MTCLYLRSVGWFKLVVVTVSLYGFVKRRKLSTGTSVSLYGVCIL